MAYDTILVETRDDVGLLTLNRPERLNAWTPHMASELLDDNSAATDLREIQRRETAMLRDCWKSPEHAEAVSAFLEKRPPKFR